MRFNCAYSDSNKYSDQWAKSTIRSRSATKVDLKHEHQKFFAQFHTQHHTPTTKAHTMLHNHYYPDTRTSCDESFRPPAKMILPHANEIPSLHVLQAEIDYQRALEDALEHISEHLKHPDSVIYFHPGVFGARRERDAFLMPLNFITYEHAKRLECAVSTALKEKGYRARDCRVYSNLQTGSHRYQLYVSVKKPKDRTQEETKVSACLIM